MAAEVGDQETSKQSGWVKFHVFPELKPTYGRWLFCVKTYCDNVICESL